MATSLELGTHSAYVAELWRYPVKSMLGESVEAVEIETRGLVGDRLFALRDSAGKFGSGKTTRRFRRIPGLFSYRAATTTTVPVVTTPDGDELPVGSAELDQLLSSKYGEPLTIVREADISHFDAGPVHLLTTASLRWLGDRLGRAAADPRRFRANIIVAAHGSTLVEEAWIGSHLRIGSVVLRATERVSRCAMPTFAQEELPADPSILRTLVQSNQQCLGLYAALVEPGIVQRGDAVIVERP